MSVVLITGGYNGEIYNPDTKTSCSFPQLPEYRNDHSQDGGLAEHSQLACPGVRKLKLRFAIFSCEDSSRSYFFVSESKQKCNAL